MDLNGTGTLPPKGTRLNGEALWSAVLNRYELEPHEQALLREIVRSVDDLDRLAGASSRNPVVARDGRVNPALNEARRLRAVLAAPHRGATTAGRRRRIAALGPHSRASRCCAQH